MVLGPQESPEEIKSREVELGSESWTCLLLPLFLNSSTTIVTLLRTAVETATAEYTSCFALARSHPVPVPNKPSRFCGRKAACLLTTTTYAIQYIGSQGATGDCGESVGHDGMHL